MPGDSGANEAFARLYQDYWGPLYAFVRCRGHSPADAEDITQGFFARLIERQSLAGLKREGGRFRSFLLASLRNDLANEWDRATAQKRGGGRPLLSLDAENGEAHFGPEERDQETPESLFEKRRAFTLLDHVMERLRSEVERAGKVQFFDEVRLPARRPPRPVLCRNCRPPWHEGKRSQGGGPSPAPAVWTTASPGGRPNRQQRE